MYKLVDAYASEVNEIKIVQAKLLTDGIAQKSATCVQNVLFVVVSFHSDDVRAEVDSQLKRKFSVCLVHH